MNDVVPDDISTENPPKGSITHIADKPRYKIVLILILLIGAIIICTVMIYVGIKGKDPGCMWGQYYERDVELCMPCSNCVSVLMYPSYICTGKQFDTPTCNNRSTYLSLKGTIRDGIIYTSNISGPYSTNIGKFTLYNTNRLCITIPALSSSHMVDYLDYIYIFDVSKAVPDTNVYYTYKYHDTITHEYVFYILNWDTVSDLVFNLTISPTSILEYYLTIEFYFTQDNNIHFINKSGVYSSNMPYKLAFIYDILYEDDIMSIVFSFGKHILPYKTYSSQKGGNSPYNYIIDADVITPIDITAKFYKGIEVADITPPIEYIYTIKAMFLGNGTYANQIYY